LSSRQESEEVRFEGVDLEALLERVRQEMGEDARILAANRVRRGGVGGFFAKEFYEVVVVPPEPAEAIVVDTTESAPPAAAQPKRTRITARGRANESAAPPTARPKNVLDLVDALNDEERESNVVDLAELEARADAVADSAHRGERFNEILGRLSANDDDGLVDGPIDGRRPMLRRDADGDIVVGSFDEVTIQRPAAGAPAPASREAQPSMRRATARAALTPPEDARREEIAALSGAATQTVPFVAPRLRRARPGEEVIERPENVLARLGLPPRYVPRGASGVALRGALIETLAKLPAAAPVPESTGVVIAVVGVASRPVVLARALAAERGLDPDNLVLATQVELGEGIPAWLQITDGPAAQERRRSWRRREHPTFVALSVPTINTAGDWARDLLDHLEPTQVWGIAHAAWKPEDIDAWAERLGGFDALALERLADTVSPAAALSLDVPIGRLDGNPATPLRWAELLLERMAAR
jgi:hypothetical protein